MRIYTYTEARQQLAALLDRAVREGEVRIKRKDGSEFTLQPAPRSTSPLEVGAVESDLTATEIVAAVREGRERDTGPEPS